MASVFGYVIKCLVFSLVLQILIPLPTVKCGKKNLLIMNWELLKLLSEVVDLPSKLLSKIRDHPAMLMLRTYNDFIEPLVNTMQIIRMIEEMNKKYKLDKNLMKIFVKNMRNHDLTHESSVFNEISFPQNHYGQNRYRQNKYGQNHHSQNHYGQNHHHQNQFRLRPHINNKLPLQNVIAYNEFEKQMLKAHPNPKFYGMPRPQHRNPKFYGVPHPQQPNPKFYGMPHPQQPYPKFYRESGPEPPKTVFVQMPEMTTNPLKLSRDKNPEDFQKDVIPENTENNSEDNNEDNTEYNTEYKTEYNTEYNHFEQNSSKDYPIMGDGIDPRNANNSPVSDLDIDVE